MVTSFGNGYTKEDIISINISIDTPTLNKWKEWQAHSCM